MGAWVSEWGGCVGEWVGGGGVGESVSKWVGELVSE